MNNPPSPLSQQLLDAVWRVEHVDGPGEVLGTAFVISPGVALTCAHVVAGGSPIVLTDRRRQRSISPSAVMLPPSAETIDLAILEADGLPPPVLPCSTGEADFRDFLSRGYSAAAPAGRELRFEPRGTFEARYSASGDDYIIDGAFELAGDMAMAGHSGSPLIASDSGAAIAVLAGGDTNFNRNWAIPFSLAAGRFPRLRAALSWNDENLPSWGPLLNAAGLNDYWNSLATAAVEQVFQFGKFDPTRHVSRAQIQEAAAEFLRSGFPVATMVGESGTGKTWLLADLVRSKIAGDALLILAAGLPREATPEFADLVVGRIATAAHGRTPWVSPPGRPAVESLLAARSVPAVILLDGLNEGSDVRNFIDRWVPGAVRWCREHGVKLICTTRPEIWPSIVSALDDPEADLFAPNAKTIIGPEGQGVADGRHGGPTARCVTIGAFTGDEAEAAAKAYQLPASLEATLQGHPLLYRIAARIGLAAPDARVGRFGLLDAYVETQLAAQIGPLNLKSSRPLRMKLNALASALDVKSGGALDWATALSIVEDDRTLDAFLSSGLLVGVGDQVRFRFDQVAEVLLPAPDDPASLFSGEDLSRADKQQLHVIALLKLDADGREQDFTIGFEALLRALDALGEPDAESGLRWDGWLLASRAVALAESLPRARLREIDAIFTSLAAAAALAVSHWGFGDLVAWIEAAPLPVRRRVELLISIGPWSNAWPLRQKDWTEPSRRYAFERALGEKDRAQVAASLSRLYDMEAASARPLLIQALSDERRIKHGQSSDSRGEATVATMAAGILFHKRYNETDALLETALAESSIGAEMLLSALVDDRPEACFDLLLPRLTQGAPSAKLVSTFARCLHKVSANQRHAAAAALRAIRTEESGVEFQIARALRTLNPNDVEAWDRIAAEFRRNPFEASLHPVPPGRFKKALEIADSSPRESLWWIGRHDGPKAEQAALARLVKRWFQDGRIEAYKFAAITEEKLYKLHEQPDAESLEPWLALVPAIIATHEASARLCLIHVTTWSLSTLPAALDRIEVALLDGGIDFEDSQTYAQKFLGAARWSDPDWLARLARIRAANRPAVDISLMIESGARPDTMQALLDYWLSLGDDEQSFASSKTTRLYLQGEKLDALFDLNRVAPLARRVR